MKNIPLVVALYEHQHFRGTKRTLVDNVLDLSDWNFADKTSSIGVHPGPDYADQLQKGPLHLVVNFFANPSFQLPQLVLGPGIYSDIHKLKVHQLGEINFGDKISSVRFAYQTDPQDLPPDPPDVPSEGDAAPMSVPLVVELVASTDSGSKSIIIVEDEPDFRGLLGDEFNDAVVSLKVSKGSHYAGERARLCRDPGNLGGYIDFKVRDDYYQLADLNFAKVASSIQIVPPDEPFIPLEERLQPVKTTPVG